MKKWRAWTKLIKLRLSLMVVFSSSMAYLWAVHREVDVYHIWFLSIGGFLITASANIMNQWWERDTDKLMQRTKDRPLITGEIAVRTALQGAGVLLVVGVTMLMLLSPIAGAIGLFSWITYVAVYTPLKRITYWSVVPGAIAGSLPVIIGCVVAQGQITTHAWILFLIQFLWQFPHTWSIAWLLKEDYHAAGLKLLPFSHPPCRATMGILFSSFLMMPTGLLLHLYGFLNSLSAVVLSLFGIGIFLLAMHLYFMGTKREASRVMMALLLYLPLLFILLYVDK